MTARTLAAAASLLAATALTLAAPMPAAAQIPDATATLSGLHPAAPSPGDTLALSGTVTNGSEQPLDNVQALLRYSRDPLEQRADVRRVVDDLEFRYGRRDERFYQVVAERLAPGGTAAFRLEVPVDEIGFVEPGVYAIGVDVRATTPTGLRLTVDTVRTLLPWLDGAAPEPVPVAMLWSLAARPALLPDDTLASDDLAGDLAGAGGLSTLLAAAGSAPVGWLVDPDLLATVDAMADGYQVTHADGVAEGSGAAAAARWRDAYRATTAGREVALQPWAEPDLSALARAETAWALDTARDAMARTREAGTAGAETDVAGSLSTVRADLVRPAGGAAEPDALAALAAAGTRTVVMSGDAVSPAVRGPLARLTADGAHIRAILTDPGLDDALVDLPASGDRSGPGPGVTGRQRWLAETAMVALAAEASGEAPRPLVAAAPSWWRPDPELARSVVDAWTTAAWVRPVGLGTVLDGAGPADRVVTPDLPASDRAAELPPDYLSQVASLGEASGRYAALLADPADQPAELATAGLRATSAAWRTDLGAARAFTSNVASTTVERLDEVTVLVPRSVTLSSRSGTFPLTVVNDLEVPVVVRLELAPANPDRLSIAALEPIRVEAGEKASVDVSASAAANGSVPVSVRLTTIGGDRLGPDRPMFVVATDYGTIGWIVVAVGALLFAGAALVNVVHRPRHRQRDTAEPVEEPVR